MELIDQSKPACVLEYGIEQPHSMTAWRMADTKPREPLSVKSIRRVLWGPYRATVEVKLSRGGSQFTLVYRVDTGDPTLHVEINGTWVEIGTPETGVPQLRAAFPLRAEALKGIYEIPFGSVERDMPGKEVPALRWAAAIGSVDGKIGGLLLLNDSKHGHTIDGKTLALTLIRSSYDPDILPEVGQHKIRLGLQPFSGELDKARATADAAAMNSPIRVVGTDIHDGRLPLTASLLTIEPSTAVLCAMKKAEDGDSIIVRCYDVSGQDTEVTVNFGALLKAGPIAAREVDILERTVAHSSASVQGSSIRFELPALGMTTVAIELG
jgi:alpha-mannosidase